VVPRVKQLFVASKLGEMVGLNWLSRKLQKGMHCIEHKRPNTKQL
jgi:hypothetical protein